MEGRSKGKMVFPVSRMRTIMKSSPGVSCISQDSVQITSRAAEEFVVFLAREAFKRSKNRTMVQYSDLAEVISTQDRLHFLHDIIPEKIKYRDYVKLLKEVEAKEQERERDAEI
ncbi:chromatin accessibility complex protein 1-like [Ornithodoros turicata]